MEMEVGFRTVMYKKTSRKDRFLINKKIDMSRLGMTI